MIQSYRNAALAATGGLHLTNGNGNGSGLSIDKARRSFQCHSPAKGEGGSGDIILEAHAPAPTPHWRLAPASNGPVPVNRGTEEDVLDSLQESESWLNLNLYTWLMSAEATEV